MSDDSPDKKKRPEKNRRDFLTGRALQSEIEHLGDQIADSLAEGEAGFPSGNLSRLETQAMACQFSLMFEPNQPEVIWPASEILDLVHEHEAQLTVYREQSELQDLNRTAFDSPFQAKDNLYWLLKEACEIAKETSGAFNPVSGPLVQLWRTARSENRVPAQNEIEAILEICRFEDVSFDDESKSVSFLKEGMQFNLGGIGKGYALDVMGEKLGGIGLESWLLHGGNSSILTHGPHNNLPGWPIGIRNPLLPTKRLATILVENCGFSASGSGIQYFRHEGKRYGHILDPRTGWPSESMLSVAVIAPTAALADALSTAFFVLGVEKTREYCDNHKEVGVLLIPNPNHGRSLNPVMIGLNSAKIIFHDEFKS